MSKVSITRSLLDGLAMSISAKSGEAVPMTLVEMKDAVDSIQTGGDITVESLSVTSNGTYTAPTGKAYTPVTVSVPTPSPSLQSKSVSYTPTESVQTETVSADSGYDGLQEVDVTVNAMPTAQIGTSGINSEFRDRTSPPGRVWVVNPYFEISTGGYIEQGTQTIAGGSYNAVPSNTTVTPSTSSQTIGGANYMMEGAVTVAAMPTGTAGTPSASKGAVSNHSVSVTPSVTNSAGYITGGTKNGTAVTVSASELVSGSETKTSNGTYNVTNLAELVVSVASGSSKNTQVVQSTTRTNASTLTAIGAELTVSTTGTYDIYYSCFRTNTSSSYTWATRLYINGTAYGTAENATWTNNQQNTHLTNISLTAGDKLRVYGRNTRGTSYYICAPMLAIVEA